MTKPWERDWGGEPAKAKKPWERDDITSQLEGAAAMGEQAQTGLAETLGDVGWQGYAGVMEGALKAPGALFGDLPMYLGNVGRRGYDRLMRLNAEDKGRPAPAPTALTPEELAGAMEKNPIGSSSVRTMQRELLGINDPGDPKTNMGRYARAGGEFAGGAAVTGAPTAGNLGRAFLGGVGFQGGRDLAPDSEVIPLAAAVAGSSVPGLVRAGGRAMVPNMDPRRAADARFLMSRGVPVYPGQAASNSLVQNIYDMARKTSLFGNDAAERQANAFTRATARTMGANTDDITQGVLDGTQRRLGNRMENIYRSTEIDADNALIGDLARIDQQSRSALQPSQLAYIERALTEAQDALATGPVNGATYWNMVKKGSRTALNNALQSADPTVATFARDIRAALEDALDRNAPAGFRPELTAAKRQYANMKTLEPLAQRSGTDDVSANALLGRVVQNTGGVRGELGRLGKAGKNVLKPVPTSGTAERLIGAGLMSSAGGIATGVGMGTVGLPAVLGAAAGASLPMGVRGLLESQTLMRMMLAKAARRGTALGRPRPPTPIAPAANATTQAISALQRPPYGAQWSGGGLLTY